MGKRIGSFTTNVGKLDLYVSDCANCGVVFGMATELEKRRREDHGTFYCPSGHTMVFNGPTQAEKDIKAAREAAKAAQARADRMSTLFRAERDQAEAAEREAAEAKASEIRLRWRVGNGVCPCCQRTFPALASHVATKHPEFVHHDLAALSLRMRELLVSIRRETEEQDTAVLDTFHVHANWNTVRALVNRGLVAKVDYSHIALTETGWALAEAAAVEVSS